MLLESEDKAAHAFHVACNIQLSFPQVQAALQTPQPGATLDLLNLRLNQDYQLLTDLLGHPGGGSVEHRILRIDYQLMRFWYKVTSIGCDLLRARTALAEMSSILAYFAAEIGENAVA